MKRLPILLLVACALLALGGCAVEPAYRYNANAGGGYYYGQSAYGNADTVIYGGGYYADPLGWWGPGWGGYPAWGYGRGWRSYGGVGFGATYTYHPAHHYRRERVESHDRRQPATPLQRQQAAPPERVAPVQRPAPEQRH